MTRPNGKPPTGGDKLTGKFMRADFNILDFTPTHTLFLMGNHQPTVGAGGHAFWRRLRLIPFAHQVEKEDRRLPPADVRRRGAAILAWIVAGAVKVINNGLTEPQCVMAATEEYQHQEDSIQQFIDECCLRVSSDSKLPSAQVYKRYVEWCRGNGIEPKQADVFGRELVNHQVNVGPWHGKRYVWGLMLLDEE